ncbi:MAG TPA: hypothetical protein VM120_17045 [Bryobacteraceae bacterium]|nr:hypothetical protein [Bryobacteraceae bacterium]
MARGWESKDVEAQIDSLEHRAQERKRPVLTPEQVQVRARRESLMMDRTRVERDLAAARHPRHQKMLRDALGHLEEKLAELPHDPVS